MRNTLVGFAMLIMAASACGSSPASPAPTDASGAEVAHSCADLPALNAAAIAAARSCDPAAGAGQCQAMARTSLPCGGCATYVNDATEANALYAEWQAQGCSTPMMVCAAECMSETPRVCVATDGGAGVCEELAR
jgi:hypothetical protein